LPDLTRGEDQTSKTKNRILTPIELLANVSRSFWMRGTVGFEPNEERIKELLKNSPMLVTAFQSARGTREDDNDPR
jgi:fumarate hydratase class II